MGRGMSVTLTRQRLLVRRLPFVMRIVVFSTVAWACCLCSAEVARPYKPKFSVDQLLKSRFPHLISNDIYSDPCKGLMAQSDMSVVDPRLEEEYKRKMEALTKNSSTSTNGHKVLHPADPYSSTVSAEQLVSDCSVRSGDGSTWCRVKEELGVVSNVTTVKVAEEDGEIPSASQKKYKKWLKKHGAKWRQRKRRRRRHRHKKKNSKNRPKKKSKKSKRKKKDRRLRKKSRKVTTEPPLHLEETGHVDKESSSLATKSTGDPLPPHGSQLTRPKRSPILNIVKLRRAKRAATARRERLWDYGVIPYVIDGNFSGDNEALFKQAMRHWENFTCIKFVPRDAEHPSWITFTERPCGCCSFVGKKAPGSQAISIGKNCDKLGIVIHELGHVVGFWHEHTRPDRDEYVDIMTENVLPNQDYNFQKLSKDEVDSLGLAYDYASIMHYARNTFSKSTYLDTILPNKSPNSAERPEIGQRIKLSEGDIAQTKLLYKCPTCGGTRLTSSGSIKSPDWPRQAGENLTDVDPVENEIFDPESPMAQAHAILNQGRKGYRCEWRISATHGERISLNVTALNIFKSDACQQDYIEIRDGYWHKSPLLGRYCGTSLPEPINLMSKGSRMLIAYHTERFRPKYTGFAANYEAICGGDLEVEHGHLESPNYPDTYQENKECVWRITVPKEYQVVLRFQTFQIENHDDCFYDFIEVRDGHAADSPLIGKYCGYKAPEDIVASGSKMYIRFKSDDSIAKAGFSAVFMKEYDECARLDHGCQHECVNTLGGFECRCRIGYELHSNGKDCEDACGGRIDSENGTIVSPSYPEMYPSNKECTWEIIAPPNHKITINFTHFDLEGTNEDCGYDKVEISSLLPENKTFKHGSYCGDRLPPSISSKVNAIRITFKADSSVQKSGFAMVYFMDKDECSTNNGGCQHICTNTIGSYVCSCNNGFVLHPDKHGCKEGGCKHEVTRSEGNFTSPNYPEFYPGEKECVWHFTTTPGHRIKLTFVEFELEPHQECTYDHIAIYDGPDNQSFLLGRFCGSKIPHPIVASSNEMYMEFKSDGSVERKGFLADHRTVCGGHLKAEKQVRHLYSHAKYGDHDYKNHEDCEWKIETAPGSRIRLTFLTFHLEDDQECGYDFVEIQGGYDETPPSFGPYCGTKIPPEITSTGELLIVRFKTDDSINAKGFSASYQRITEPGVDPKATKPTTDDKVTFDNVDNEVRKDGLGDSDLDWRFEYFRLHQ